MLPLVFALTTSVPAQDSTPSESPRLLILTGAIPLPEVQGRIDHLSADQQGRLYVSALGKNTEEVVDFL